VVLGSDPGAEPILTGFTRLGDIWIVDDAVVSSSGLSPLLRDLNRSDDPESQIIDVIERQDPVGPLPDDEVLLTDTLLPGGTRLVLSYRTRTTGGGPPASMRGSGKITVRARDLWIRDSDIRAETVGTDAESVDIGLTGDLEIRKSVREADAGILATSGRIARGFLVRVIPSEPGMGCVGAAVACRVIATEPTGFGGSLDFVEYGPLDVDLTQGTGRGSFIRVVADDVRLIDGGRISTTSLSGGAPGSITIEARGDVTLEGEDPFAPDLPDVIGSSAIASNHQGRPADAAAREGGRIDITAGTLLLRDGSGVFAQTTGDGDAGDIDIRVRDLVVLDDSQIDSSTSGQSLGENPGDATTSGESGSISVNASRSVLLAGSRSATEFARLSTFSQRRSTGGAGSIEVTSPSIVIRDGAGLAVTTEGEGTGGDIFLRGGELRMENGARLSASSEATLEPAGDIRIETAGSVRLRTGSSVAADTGISSGGNIGIRSGQTMLLLEDSSIRADAGALGGSGGRVVIEAPLLVRSAASEISADAPGGPEFQGEVEIRSPVVDLESQVRPPAVEFLDAASLLASRCAARRSGDRSGSFQAARWPGLPFAYDGPLLAYGALESTAEETSAGAERRSETLVAASDVDGWRAPLRSGEAAFRAGRFDEAERRFDEAVRLTESGGGAVASDDGEGTLRMARVDALRGLARARQMNGDYAGSEAPLERAEKLAHSGDDAGRAAMALGELGAALVALRDFERAEVTLERGVSAARSSGDARALALALNQLGTLRASQGRAEDAAEYYHEAAERAGTVGDALLEAQALANAARAGIGRERPEQVRASLALAEQRSADLDQGIQTVALRIHLAESEARLGAQAPRLRSRSLLAAHRLLLEASAEAGAIGDDRLRSRVYGSLGGLYEREGGRSAEALYLTRRAMEAADRARAPELLARWHTQAGRIQWAAGDLEHALASHRRAVSLLEEVRPESRARYGGPETSFRRAFEPSYLALVDALIERSEHDRDTRSALLFEARDTVEQWKSAELRDYFRDDCVAALESSKRSLEEVAGTAAVVYPIPLDDRLELLVSTPAGIERHRIPVSRAALLDEVEAFRSALEIRSTYAFRGPAQTLFAWLVEPYLAGLEEAGIDTLVVVPDEILRTIPFGALHDGKRFAVERIAVAVTPSLRLIAPRRLEPARSRILLAGLTESVQGYPELENVRAEIDAVHERYGGRVLMDGDFRAERLESELRERPPGVVHIASHAEFTGDPGTSFVLAHDRRLPIEELSRWVESNRFGNEPLELILLSACETAAGSEQAALGLAGLAVRSGARSAVGSLWSVNDEATSRLIVAFYEALGTPDASKAEALARAQRALIQDRRFDHPFYWAGFMVINNWL
jgi:CHAT domain-containing protein